MDKELLKKYIDDGKTQKEIGDIAGLNYRTVSYWIRKHGLFESTRQFQREQSALPNSFMEIVDTKEKAYVLGFILGDGCVIDNESVIINLCMNDKEVLEFIATVINANVKENNITNRKSRIFPHVTITKKIPHIIKHLGGRLKEDRHFPRVKDNLMPYMLLGFFDADGHITFGRRKDRNRFWQSVGFTHHLKCLTGLQQFLIKKLSISTVVAPKTGENAFCIRFGNKKDVLKFINYIYPDDSFVILRRKYDKCNAVRLELGEFGEGSDNRDNTEPSIESLLAR